MLLSEDVGHFSLVRALHLADLITLMNGMPLSIPSTRGLCVLMGSRCLGFCGVMSIFHSLRYCLGDPNSFDNMWIALAFLPFGLFFDFFDGKVARWRKKSGLMGQELDSLADLVWPAPNLELSVSGGIRADIALEIEANVFCALDLFRRRPGHGGLYDRSSFDPRHRRSYLLRALRSYSTCSFQRDGRHAPQGCHRQEPIL